MNTAIKLLIGGVVGFVIGFGVYFVLDVSERLGDPYKPSELRYTQDTDEIVLKSEKMMRALAQKNTELFLEVTHPDLAVVIKGETDFKLSQQEFVDFFSDATPRVWGYADGTGDPLFYDFNTFVDNQLRPQRFTGSETNLRISAIENEVTAGTTMVSFYDPGEQELDWRVLNLMFDEKDGNWVVVGISYNHWRI